MIILNRLLAPRTIEAACACNKGKVRENNEDNFYFGKNLLNSDNDGLSEPISDTFELETVKLRGELFAVFDGMGGTQYGEIASHNAARATLRYLSDQDSIDSNEVSRSLVDLCNYINKQVYEAGSNLGVSSTGTTIAGLYFFNGKVWSCNVGDSRCYRFRDGVLQMLSEDHVEDMYTENNDKKRKKPGLIQYIGMDPDEIRIEPTIVSDTFRKHDTYLVCSDGLTDMVPEDDIASVMGSANPKEIVSKLIEMANANGGRDNITIIACTCL